MKYRGGFKYQLSEDVILQTSFYPSVDIVTPLLELNTNGELKGKAGYAWDGTSGPVIDRKTNMTPSFGHDGLYELMRRGYLDYSEWHLADFDFIRWTKDRGAWWVTRKIDISGLWIAQGRAANPKNKKKIRTAP